MSGTSRDGIDAALIRTDGEGAIKRIDFRSEPYDDLFRDRLASACRRAIDMAAPAADSMIDDVAAELTERHARIVAGWDADVIGFHGHTVAHRPDRGWTWQIGDGAALARQTAIDVVADLRSDDVAAGGQGAPLLPVYHRALTRGLEKPTGVLNLGGVANLTLIGADGSLVAFDTGMASALIDDWMQLNGAGSFDANGDAAGAGRVNEAVVTAMLDHPWFDQPPPKSIDREDFTLEPVRGLALEDGAATLTAFSARAVALALQVTAARPARLIVAGGGRRNATLMRMIEEATGVEVEAADLHGWNGDAVEAEGFAYMAVRSLRGLPISFPGTTGAPREMTGGTLHRH
ncbi:anhydro-N-acetylmuramic acid kinase [Sphingomonas jejuensis]|uniref:Anhydro-N-acetylmuramic acid kinase n=2 Tax=Sphingomonas jejuensis TaxID=904715 RepID=A0ABX0XL45_9SPHN|nr:anhydro-N-acetylmuramic acid kinase [Sphingomonas jejuensis]